MKCAVSLRKNGVFAQSSSIPSHAKKTATTVHTRSSGVSTTWFVPCNHTYRPCIFCCVFFYSDICLSLLVCPKRPFVRSALAFSKERFVLPRVTVREAGEGSRLSGLVLTFVYAAGDIVRVRSDPVCERLKKCSGCGNPP